MRKTLITSALLIILSVSIALAIIPLPASAGESSQGYAQIAQTAINNVGHYYGYKTTCIGIYTNYATGAVKVTCTMTP